MITCFGDLFKAVGTDKQGPHDYGPVYDSLFPTPESRLTVRRVLELGGGPSVRAWVMAFPNAVEVVAADKDTGAAGPHLVQPASTVKCDLATRQGVEQAARAGGAAGEPFDLIVDDASHTLPDILLAWHVLWPRLAPGGVYAVEDVQSQEDLDVLARLPGAEVYDRRASGRYDDVIVAFRKPW